MVRRTSDGVEPEDCSPMLLLLLLLLRLCSNEPPLLPSSPPPPLPRAPIERLQNVCSSLALNGSVAPPLDQGVMWSTSASEMSRIAFLQ